MTIDAYELMIAILCDNRPWGYRNAGEIRLNPSQLGTVIADTDDADVMEQVMADPHCLAELRDAFNPAYPPANMDEAVGAVLTQYASIYAQGKVFDDVCSLLHKREDAELEAEELAEMPATETDLERMGTPVELL